MLTLDAPAKLNLYLHIVGKREDGYHRLDSLAAFVDIGDRLTLTPAPALRFKVDGPFAGVLDDSDGNLVIRAARALGKAVGRDPTVAFHLTKRLPVASGIGGGSADAAACLRGLAALWGLDPNSDTMLEVAAGLGADIPVCLIGKAAFMRGIGTEFSLAPRLPSAGVVLVNPNIALSTPAVYRARVGEFSAPMPFESAPVDARALCEVLAERGNDLTMAAVTLVPEIQTVLAAIAIDKTCLLSRMSGSGATCFGLYQDRAAADDAALALSADHPDWWVAAGQLAGDSQ
jgi:4-diphosphocytidyl-2-C-methyl-D-erythritol kinase